MIAKLKKPPMGWNSYDSHNWSCTEDEFIENCEFVDKNLKQFGFEYMVLDFGWSNPGRTNEGNPNQTSDLKPALYMDSYGRLIPTPDRFPNSLIGNSLKYLADFCHGKGMKFGLHLMRGVPRQAVAAKLKIKGTDITIDTIAKEGEGWPIHCTWVNQMLGIDMSKEGAQEYIDSCFELYNEWEVDFVKIDDLSYPYHTNEIEGFYKAINKLEREIVFSTSPGATPIENGEHISTFSNMWRISPDFWDFWKDIYDQFERFENWAKYRKDGAYPDGDMMPMSKISMFGPYGDPRYPRLTIFEKKTIIAVWLINSSPLILGGDLRIIDDTTLSLLTNPMFPLLNRFAKNGRVDSNVNGLIKWLADGTEFVSFMAYTNTSEELMQIEVDRNKCTELFSDTKRAKYLLYPHESLIYSVDK